MSKAFWGLIGLTILALLQYMPEVAGGVLAFGSVAFGVVASIVENFGK